MLNRALVLLPLVLAGLLRCVPAPAEHGSVSENGMSLNGMSLNGMSLNKLALDGLSLEGRAQAGLAELVATPSGREVLSYVVRCALPEGEALSAKIDGAEVRFPGLLGLAPE